MKVGIKKLPNGADLPLPHYATPGSAGLDLLAATDSEIALAPGARLAVPTGIAIELPLGVEAQVRPRSGLALNHGITSTDPGSSTAPLGAAQFIEKYVVAPAKPRNPA